MNSFVGPGAKGLEELKKMPNGDKLVNGLKAAIEEGLRTKYNITTNNLDIEKISPKGTMELIARQSLFGKILRSPLTALSEENKIAYFMKFLPEAANSKEMNKFLLEQLGE